MNMKTIFFTLFISAIFISKHTQAMFISPKMYKTIMHKAKAYSTHTDQTYGIIQDYEIERDEKTITPIAFKNAHKLTSGVTEKNRTKETEYIMMTLDASTKGGSTTKVYLIDNEPIGFINYYIDKKQPWYQQYMPHSFKPKAFINCLAINDNYQGKGIGTALLNYALNDCKNKSAKWVQLSTTHADQKLKEYYEKFGFISEGYSKFTGVEQFKKEFEPGMFTFINEAIVSWIQKKFKE